MHYMLGVALVRTWYRVPVYHLVGWSPTLTLETIPGARAGLHPTSISYPRSYPEEVQQAD